MFIYITKNIFIESLQQEECHTGRLESNFRWPQYDNENEGYGRRAIIKEYLEDERPCNGFAKPLKMFLMSLRSEIHHKMIELIICSVFLELTYFVFFIFIIYN